MPCSNTFHIRGPWHRVLFHCNPPPPPLIQTHSSPSPLPHDKHILWALHFNQGTKGYFNLTTAVFCQMATLSYIVHITHQKAQRWWECTVNYPAHRYGGYLIWNWILAFLDLLYKWRSMFWRNAPKVYEESDGLFSPFLPSSLSPSLPISLSLNFAFCFVRLPQFQV